MAQIKDGDFVKVNFDVYANGNLVQTTDEVKGKAAKLQVVAYGPQTMIVGRAFILKAFDEGLKKKDKDILELKAEDAFGKRKKELLKTFPKSAFDEQKLKPIVGMTYDFNGMYGAVKSVVGGRIMVDFNSPLAGKDIKLDYTLVEVVSDISEKISVVMSSAIRLPKNMYAISVSGKDVILKVPKQLFAMKDMLIKSLGEMISNIKDYNIKIEELVSIKK